MEYIYFLYFFIFSLGLAVGSFLNCIIYRLEIGESFLKGRSYCPHCKHKLSWKDLIPVLSFLILKRRCRYCQKNISWQYPLVELITGLLFILILNKFLISNLSFLNFLYYLIISCFLIIIFVYDLKHYIIPDEVIFLAIGTAFLYQIFNSQLQPYLESLVILNPILSAIGAAGFFLFIFLISKGKWLGFGDVKLAFFMGLFLGFPSILVALFFAFFIGAIIGIGLILASKKTLKSQVPFGPFLVLGTFIAFYIGEKIINWYLDFI